MQILCIISGVIMQFFNKMHHGLQITAYAKVNFCLDAAVVWKFCPVAAMGQTDEGEEHEHSH